MRESVKLSEADRKLLIERLQMHDSAALQRSHRAAARLQLPDSITIQVLVCHPGGGEVLVRAVVKDISRTGMGMLYGGYLHLDTQVLARFVEKDGTPIFVQGGKVVRCTHVRGVVHEVGIRFDTEITADARVLALDAGAPQVPVLNYTQLEALSAELSRLIRSRAAAEPIGRTVRAIRESIVSTHPAIDEPRSAASTTKNRA